METKTIFTVILWILVALFIIPNYIEGFRKIFSQKQKVEMFERWGYSIAFIKFIGWVEVIGSSLVLFHQTRFLAIPVYAILLSGAVCTHLKNKENKDVMGRFICGSILTALLIVTCWI
jgi:putative oxidoreductase